MEATHFIDQFNWIDGDIENSDILPIGSYNEHISDNACLRRGQIVAIFKIKLK